MKSIYGKIMLSFVVLTFLMAALAAFAFFDMLYLDKRVYQGIAVSKIEHSVIEMRLHEKNLFLYKNNDAGITADQFATHALKQLNTEHDTIKGLLDPIIIQDFQNDIVAYRKLLDNYLQKGKHEAGLESTIRTQGHKISQIAEKLSESERHTLATAISSTKFALAWSIIILALLVFVVGWTLAHYVVKPLRRLPLDLDPIAKGRFDHLEINSKDAEMLAFSRAFNSMLGELEIRRKRLLRSEKLAAMGVLVAGVAHEMKNPLSNISSTAQLMQEDVETASRTQLIEWARAIDGESERLRRIVDTIQEFGHHRETPSEKVLLAKLITETVMLVRSSSGDSNLEVIIDVPEEIVIMAYAHRIQQAFRNLLLNSKMSGDIVTIRITASDCDAIKQPIPIDAEVIGDSDCYQHDGVQTTQIVFADNGSGIDAESLSKVFEPFYTTREPGQGMGLGLYIVQEIVQEHEGCIALVSRKNIGTEVFVLLPCATQETA